MEITLQDIIEKHKTNINTKSMSKKLNETVLFSDTRQNGYFYEENLSLKDIPEPEHKVGSNEKGDYEKYTYKFKDYELTILYEPNDYRSMDISITKQTPDDPYNKIMNLRFDYKGEQWGVKY